MNAGLRDVLARAEVRKQLINLGATAQTSTPEEMRQHIVNEIAKWGAVREKAGIAQQ
jgi:tripartite-type tricarboxylate transporter receptor subunit TctC